MAIIFYNSASRQLEPFEPMVPGEVRMYNCGPTVYKSQHIGNFRSYLLADLLRRHLEMRGFEVKQVMNITDVGHLTEDDIDQGEDKMMKAARAEDLDPYQIARKYEAEFHRDRETLRMKPAMEYPRATEHIPEMLDMIQGLLDRGHAYVVSGNVYYEQASFPSFGSLSGKKVDDLIEGARVEVDPRKKDPRDFALWKTDAKHLMQWDAPWGRGFPGWHIECSAMSRKFLGDQFDIHTGGEDNVFPHHECEIAQSEGYTGKHPFVRYWLHGRHLLVGGEKMAKRKGTLYSVEDLLEQGYSGDEIRLAITRVQYRMPINFTLEGLEDARKFLGRVRECRSRLVRIREGREAPGADPVDGVLAERETEFGAALDDDLNVSEAVAALASLVGDLNRLSPDSAGAAAALSLFKKLDDWIACLGEEPRVETEEGGVTWAGASDDSQKTAVTELALRRESARRSKDFAEADRLRGEIQELGFKLVDTPAGPRIEPGQTQ